MNLIPKPPYQHLADELRRRCPDDFVRLPQESDPDFANSCDQRDILDGMDLQFERGNIEWIKNRLKDWTERLHSDREDMIG